MSEVSQRARWALLQQISGAGLMVATAVVTARWLGPAAKGELSLLMAWAFFGSVIFALGMPQALATWISRDEITQRQGVVTSMWLALVSAVAAGVVALALKQWGTPTLGLIAAFLPVATGLMVLTAALNALGAGAGDLRVSAIGTLIPSAVTLVAYLGLFLAGVQGEYQRAAQIWLASIPVGLVVSLWLLWRTKAPQLLIAWSELRRMAAFGSRSMTAQMFSALNMRLDVVLLGILATTSDVGLYAIATSAANLVNVVPSAMGQALSRSFGERKMELDGVLRAIRVVLLVSAASALALGVIAVPLVRAVFGKPFGPSASMIIAILPGSAIYGVVPIVLQYAYNWRRHPGATSRITGIIFSVDMLLLALLAPRLGGLGAAIASGVSYFIGAVLALIYMKRWLDVGFRDLLIPRSGDLGWAVTVLLHRSKQNQAEEAN